MISTKKQKKGRKYRKLKIALIFMIVVLMLTIGIAISYYNKATLPMEEKNPRDITIEIPLGSSSIEIAKILKDSGLIRDELVFRIALKREKAESSLKAGSYVLNTSMSVYEIIEYLSKGGKNTNVVKFTIPEGYELKDMAKKLSDEGLVDANRFMDLVANKDNFEDKFPFLKELKEGQSLEGYLFPSTYEIYIGSTEEEIIERMLAKFQEVYDETLKGEMDKVDMTLNEVVTLASIIEREAKRDDERVLISGVFHNRLKIDMPLQSCATVQYVLGERKENLSTEDVKIDSIYNTYIHKGLPPAPIASPGEKSLIAAVKPADVDYLYFRAKEDGTGGHIFSVTYEEHIKADPSK
ncbi:MAG: endolytic transglycosylase MltG [Tissierellia bacterium]|nr:endolytic transglycosylase MltG [Tissierellia bacterium]